MASGDIAALGMLFSFFTVGFGLAAVFSSMPESRRNALWMALAWSLLAAYTVWTALGTSRG